MSALAAPRIATLTAAPLTHPGGVSAFVAGLVEALERGFGARVEVIAPERERGGPGRRAAQAALVAEQFAWLLRFRPDVVHVQGHPALLAAAVAYRTLAARAGPVRVVHTVHVDPVQRTADWKRATLGWLLGRCAAVTTVSADTARRLVNVADPLPASIRVIHGAANITVRQPDDPAVAALRAELGLGPGPVLCQVGPLLFPAKVAGLVRLIEALGQVRTRFPDTRLLVVGDGPLRGEVEAAAARVGIAGAVTVTGYLPDVSLPLALADIYCHISLQDACPISLLEAMQSGKAVVAARTGGIPEVIADGVDGLLVEAEPAQIATAILRLLEQPEQARRLGRQAAATARVRFTWDRVAAEYAALYGLIPCHVESEQRSPTLSP